MSTLPFKLRKYHKYSSRQNWEKRGLIFVDDEHFVSVYNEYIHATNCYLCNKLFPSSRDRQLDYDRKTGNPRHIVCQYCNMIKIDDLYNT